MDSLLELVGLNIKQIRKTKNLTQDALAEKCGLQSSFLAGVERGDRNITLQTLEKIIEGLEVLPIQIFKVKQNNLEKQELLISLNNFIENKSEEEIRLILNIATDIFNTYK